MTGPVTIRVKFYNFFRSSHRVMTNYPEFVESIFENRFLNKDLKLHQSIKVRNEKLGGTIFISQPFSAQSSNLALSLKAG